MVEFPQLSGLNLSLSDIASFVEELILTHEKESINLSIQDVESRRHGIIVRLQYLMVNTGERVLKKIILKAKPPVQSTNAIINSVSAETLFYSTFKKNKCLPKTLFAGFSNAISCNVIVQENPYATHREWCGVPGTIELHNLRKMIQALASFHNFPMAKKSKLFSFLTAPYEQDINCNPQLLTNLFSKFLLESQPFYSDTEIAVLNTFFNTESITSFYKARSRYLISVTHNDPNECNFLYSRSEINDFLLIDWETWSYGPVTNDIAYLLVLCISPEYRVKYELEILKDYFGYMNFKNSLRSWKNFIYDYTCSVRRCVYIVISYWYRLGVPLDRIQAGLKRAIIADRYWRNQTIS